MAGTGWMPARAQPSAAPSRRARVARARARCGGEGGGARSGAFGSGQRKWAAHRDAGGSEAGGDGKAHKKLEGPSTPSNAAALTAAFEADAPSRQYAYVLSHTREPPAMAACREQTAAKERGANMLSAPEQCALLRVLVRSLRATRALEVGVFTGYSALAIADALEEGGTLVACERDPKAMAEAEAHFERAGLAHRIDARLGPAKDTLEALLDDEDNHASFDLAFIDADKRGYMGYYEQCLKLVRPGGLIIVDNVLWYGKCADPGVDDKTTAALREFNDFVYADERVDHALAPVGDGMAVCCVR